MPSGRKSLYLDIYIDGRMSYEYLKLYIEKGGDAETRRRNAEVTRLARAVAAQRTLDVENGRFGLGCRASSTNIAAYMDSLSAGLSYSSPSKTRCTVGSGWL